MNNDFFKGLKRFSEIAGLPSENLNIIYNGELNINTLQGNYISWRNI